MNSFTPIRLNRSRVGRSIHFETGGRTKRAVPDYLYILVILGQASSQPGLAVIAKNRRNPRVSRAYHVVLFYLHWRF